MSTNDDLFLGEFLHQPTPQAGPKGQIYIDRHDLDYRDVVLLDFVAILEALTWCARKARDTAEFSVSSARSRSNQSIAASSPFPVWRGRRTSTR